jgi:two-component system sensor histidine kinase KdpD
MQLAKGDGNKGASVIGRRNNLSGRRTMRDYASAAAVVGLCTLVGSVSYWSELTDANIVMIFLAGIAFCAARYGQGPSLAAIGLSIVSFSFFIIRPPFSFSGIDKQYLITLVVTVGMSWLIAELTSRLRTQLATSQLQEGRTVRLYEMTRELGAATEESQVIAAAIRQLGATFNGSAAIYEYAAAGETSAAYADKEGFQWDERNREIAKWVAEHRRPAGQGTEQWGDFSTAFAPIVASRKVLGVVAVRSASPNRFHDAEERRMLETRANLIGIALERCRSQRRAQEATVQVETERLRNNLLTAISHDLRSPLATIATTTSALLEDPSDAPWNSKREVLETIVDETRQLSRQVDNLLDMGRLDSGESLVHQSWEVLDELVAGALGRLRRELGGRSLKIDIPADFPLLYVARDLMEQVLVNLLENAVRYTPPASTIEISGHRRGDRAEITIADNGRGLPAGEAEKLFEKFYRGNTPIADGRRGLGLGLAICRSIVEAHAGRISAGNRLAGGAEFVISLPFGDPPQELSVAGVSTTAGADNDG